MNLAHPVSYMGPMPWYLQVRQFWSFLWNDLKIILVIHHIPLTPLECIALVGLAVAILGLALARKR